MEGKLIIALTLVSSFGVCISYGNECSDGYEWNQGKKALYWCDDDELCCLECGERCCKENVNKRIGKGEDAIEDEFPWSAAVFEKQGNRFKFICGGVLIRSKLVLTAAHCLNNNGNEAKRYYVSVGEQDIFIDKDGIRQYHSERLIPTKKSKRHRIYTTPTPEGIRGDVALLELARKSNKPIACINPEFRVKYGDNLSNISCQAIGYGITETGNMSRILQRANVELRPFNVYKSQFFDRIRASKLEGGAAGCPADSGSPVVCTDNTTPCGFSYVAGIMSYKQKERNFCDGTENILANLLDTRQDGLVNWVKQEISRLSSNCDDYK